MHIPELQHHQTWLAETVAAVRQAGQAGVNQSLRSQLEQGRRVCTAVLAQNPESALARSVLADIHRLLGDPVAGPVAAAPTAQHNDDERVITSADVQMMERIIEGIERGMQQLEAKVDDQLRRNPSYAPQALSVPFQLLRGNIGNPYKNFTKVWLAMHEGRGPSAYRIGYGQYGYDFVPERFAKERGDVFGNYDAQNNIIRMPEGFNPDCLLEIFLIFHEILHAFQNHALRERIGDARYRAFYEKVEGQHRVLLPQEVEAYGVQFEMMNIALGGWLQAGAKEGDSEARIDRLLAETGGGLKHRELARSMLTGIRVMYPHGWRDDKQPPCSGAFYQGVKQAYANEGILYVYDRQGLPVPLLD